MKREAAVYIRFGSETVGFCLPADREAFKQYMNRDKNASPRRKVQAWDKKSKRIVWR